MSHLNAQLRHQENIPIFHDERHKRRFLSAFVAGRTLNISRSSRIQGSTFTDYTKQWNTILKEMPLNDTKACGKSHSFSFKILWEDPEKLDYLNCSPFSQRILKHLNSSANFLLRYSRDALGFFGILRQLTTFTVKSWYTECTKGCGILENPKAS